MLNVTLSPIGYNPLPARPISPEKRIGMPVVTQICYIYATSAISAQTLLHQQLRSLKEDISRIFNTLISYI